MVLGGCSMVNSRSEKENENMQMIKLVESKEAKKHFYIGLLMLILKH